MDEVKSLTETVAEVASQAPEPAAAINAARDNAEEIHELLRLKQSRRMDGNRIPCPSCTVPVEITINRCPFCESDIAGEAALARETTRRLREISGELDLAHARLTAEPPKPRGFFERLACVFKGDPEPDPNANRIDPFARRLLTNITRGDSLKVLDENGPWLKIKTASGDIGWVYSTVRSENVGL